MKEFHLSVCLHPQEMNSDGMGKIQIESSLFFLTIEAFNALYVLDDSYLTQAKEIDSDPLQKYRQYYPPHETETQEKCFQSNGTRIKLN